MDAHDDVVLGGVGVGHVRYGEPTDTGMAVSNGDGLHWQVHYRTPTTAKSTAVSCRQRQPAPREAQHAAREPAGGRLSMRINNRISATD